MAAGDPPQQPEGAAAAAAAVGSFVQWIPAAGVHPMHLLLRLVALLAGAPESAAALSAPERELLLRAAERVQEEGEACGLAPACCLVLAELCLSCAASEAEGGGGAAGGQHGRPRSRAGHGERPLSRAALRRCAEQWLLRYLSATAVAELAGQGGAPFPPPAAAAPAAAAAAAAGVQAAAPLSLAAAAPPAEGSASGAAEREPAEAAVRYWWARGQVEEARGAVSEAVRLYQRCLQALTESGEWRDGSFCVWPFGLASVGVRPVSSGEGVGRAHAGLLVP